MKEDQCDDMTRAARAHYHRPPATPRDAIWASIAAARQEQRVRPAVRLRWLKWTWIPAAAAALLLIGITIGRHQVSHDGAAPPRATSASISRGEAEIFRHAARPYLTQMDALLSEVKATASLGDLPPAFAARATDLLFATRLLMDSPAAEDVELALLLQDLEFVLAQVVFCASAPAPPEPGLLVDGMDRRGVLLRLRTALGTQNTRDRI